MTLKFVWMRSRDSTLKATLNNADTDCFAPLAGNFKKCEKNTTVLLLLGVPKFSLQTTTKQPLDSKGGLA